MEREGKNFIFVFSFVVIISLGFVNAGFFKTLTGVEGGVSFSPEIGDVNQDGVVNGLDVEFLSAYLFEGGPAPNPLSIADFDTDGKVSIGDLQFLIDLVFVQGNQTVECSSDSDCVSDTTNFCNSEGAACVSTTYYICEGFKCVPSGGSAGCTPVCPNGCSNGACIESNETIACSKDSDCGESTSVNYCSGDSACTSTTSYTCNNPGTVESFCAGSSGGTCHFCPGDCRDGICVIGVGENVDSVKFEKSSAKLNLGESITDVWPNSVTDDDFPTFLKDSSVDIYQYEQKINMGNNLVLQNFSDSDYNNKEWTFGFRLISNTHVLNYTLDFLKDPPVTSLEAREIFFLGDLYRVIEATSNKLTLLDAEKVFSVSEGETVTVTAGDKSYEVSISFIDSANVKFDVNGETVPPSGKLPEGGTYKLSDGNYLGVIEILKSDYVGSIGSVSFSIGKGKVEINSGNDIKWNDAAVQGIKGWLHGVSTSVLDKIVIEWRLDDESFVTEDRSLKIGGFETLQLRFEGMTWESGEYVGHTYLDGFYGGEKVPVGGVCSGLINKVSNPEQTFTFNDLTYKLIHSRSYNFGFTIGGDSVETAKAYTASWRTFYDESNEYLDYTVYVFDNQDIDLTGFLEKGLDEVVCRAASFWDENEQENKIYVCNWDILKHKQSRDNYQSDHRYIFWTNDNIFVEIYTSKGRWLSDEEVLRLGQENIQNFLDDLRDNRAEYIGWNELGIDYPFSGLLAQDLVMCSSDILLDICSPSWSCNVEPVVCPPHGSQEKTCKDFACGNEIKETISCTPGICNGCLVPKWFGSKWFNNKCIPYGFRFEQLTNDYIDQIVEESGRDTIGDDDLGDDGSLVVESNERAVLTLYYEGTAYEYVLTPGAEVSLTDFPGFGEAITFIMVVNEIVYKPEGGSYVDITTKYSYLGRVREKFNAYCDLDGKIKEQKTPDLSGNWATCQNNYECFSNTCSSGECIEVTTLLQEAGAFKTAAVKFFCKVFNPFSDEQYENCVNGFLGSQDSSSTGGGGSSGP